VSLLCDFVGVTACWHGTNPGSRLQMSTLKEIKKVKLIALIKEWTKNRADTSIPGIKLPPIMILNSSKQVANLQSGIVVHTIVYLLQQNNGQLAHKDSTSSGYDFYLSLRKRFFLLS
jgi:hypothetical protein